MSQRQIQVTCTRGGREFSRRSFSFIEAQQTTFGHMLDEQGLTTGLGDDFEIYVRDQEGDTEISAHSREQMSLESVLRAASQDGEIAGKTFIIDCTAEHKGARSTRS
jgi:hypothetical protein